MSAELAAEVAGARWYHGMELPGGIVTPGDYDLRDTARRIPLPRSLVGRRCLDVGTRDGFWAFEMERRGADEVVAIDLDDPDELDFPEPRPQLTRSGPRRVDFAFIGTLLLHLRNPVDALAAVRRVLRPDGLMMSNDAVSLPLTVLRPRTPPRRS